MTRELFREDSYLRSCDATVMAIHETGVDLQPCGGTHVASMKETGRVRVQKIGKRDKQNRRIIIVFDE